MFCSAGMRSWGHTTLSFLHLVHTLQKKKYVYDTKRHKLRCSATSSSKTCHLQSVVRGITVVYGPSSYTLTHALQAELGQDSCTSVVSKSGVCLEYLKGACTKDTVCPFSHSLKDYYVHVCKRKPHACISKRAAVETFVCTLSQCRQSTGDVATRCKRSYMLRCLIPSILPGDQKRAEAVVAVLVRSDCDSLPLVLTGML